MSLVVAIDGPAASGKSTVAKELAKRLGLVHIDTGAMYRAITYLVLKEGLDPQNEEQSCSVLDHVNLELTIDGKIIINGDDVTRIIREGEVTANVSYIASYKKIRLFLVDMQREMSKNLSIVMDGRDIGTYVLPNADVKIFMIASVETRAQRRHKENLEKGIPSDLKEIEAVIKKRDFIDSHREFAPLVPASDSITLDSSNINIEEAVEACIKIIEKKVEEKNKTFIPKEGE
ncbi:MAG: (d)CMP kinase [Bacilli bacterium]|nr:(d)CMP kinase [Bacilli bacterium]MDD6227300.1 (d)CMP kinase [Bacilli bacterium]MDD7375052.1 (d)CMP kinase [Bacilli bacterium]MDD7549940.1 (d)CMP kinase [Bacilli bacterium]MDD7598409.1 (d)CMP kinase [Bacilli bacterium]